ncbi:MAG: endonuclease/exonuclease/phosphatase family protein [Bacteroidota bacterium]|nr:endonuclease/exonuclease/phosphatase family protein [Bacteroidota bacterium]MDP4196284.1 endonuclease/exonuclease/phosphatase family protein [Bacteroidota bacterium]
MTYNIHHGQGMDGKIDIKRISDICKDANADLIALQEVDRGVERTGKIDIMNLLKEYTDLSIAFGKNIDFQGGDYGNGILSKYKIDSVKNIHYKMIRPGEQRGMLQSVVNINGENVVFIDTHTGDKSNDEEKQMNVDEIISAIKDYPDMPVILCGDFNSTPDTKMHKALKEYFVDIWEMLNGSNGYSFPSVNPDRRIDYIYISKNILNRIKPLSIKLIRSEASDHLPVVAEFELLGN